MSKRITGTIQMVPGKDDDLIRWFTNLPSGNRNDMLKQVLRFSLFDVQPEQPQPVAVTPAQVDIDALRQEWERWTHELLKDLPGYVHNLVQQTMDRVQLPHQEEPVVTEAERISTEDKLKRKNNLKKAQW